MHKLLPKLFIKNYQDTSDEKVRIAYGTLASIFGIVTNTILAVIKIIVSIFTFSKAILADGVNNLMDSTSSIISLIGFQISGKKADIDHPFGHERMEYIVGLIISCIIMIVGFTFLKDSVVGIYNLINKNPDSLNLDKPVIVLSLLGISILIKVGQAIFYQKLGKTINSLTIQAESQDSFNDILTTLAVTISSIVYLLTKGSVNIDSIAGLIVAGFIIISGIELIKDTINPLLGVEPSHELINSIAGLALGYPGVLGIHDLMIHSYGKSKVYATLHVEVDASVDVIQSHELIDRIEQDVKNKLNVNLVIHMDPVDLKDPELLHLKESLAKILKDIDERLSSHDVRLVKGANSIKVLFDIVIPADFKMKEEDLTKIIVTKLKEINELFDPVINYDQFYNQF